MDASDVLNANPWTVLVLSVAGLAGLGLLCRTVVVMADKPHGPEIVGKVVEVFRPSAEDDYLPALE